MQSRERMLLLFGGRSAEHDISVRSATEVAAAVDRARWDLVLVAIDREGNMRRGEGDFGPGEVLRNGPAIQDLRELAPTVVFPLLHGPYGEDGTIQGHLETIGLPYVGSGVLASSLCMDKCQFKRTMRACDVPTLPAIEVTRRSYRKDRESIHAGVLAQGLPAFVKPANMGSSIGISRVTEIDQLAAALTLAFRYDDVVLIERGAKAPREIELAVLGNHEDDLVVSGAGEIVLRPGEWYDFDTKYVNDHARLDLPAEIPTEWLARLTEHARAGYLAAGCSGLARIDFLVESETGKAWLNEINTLPGFTSISMYPKLMGASGYTYSQLINRLCELGLERAQARRALLTH